MGGVEKNIGIQYGGKWEFPVCFKIFPFIVIK